MWDPGTYLAFEDERSRPFFDLVRRVGAEDPQRVVDLGCGPGQLTATLAERWPRAHVLGVDSSTEMLEAAEAHAIAGRLTFAPGDAATWEPDGPIDVLVTNAALQWVPDHRRLLARYASWLAPGGWFAMQVPGNFDQPSHELARQLASSPRWKATLGGALTRGITAVDTPQVYAAELIGAGCRVDAWETTYLQVLAGPDAVLNWIRGTALRPVLTALDPAGRDQFLAELAPQLRDAYPERPWGTSFPFRRVFVVAQRPA